MSAYNFNIHNEWPTYKICRGKLKYTGIVEETAKFGINYPIVDLKHFF